MKIFYHKYYIFDTFNNNFIVCISLQSFSLSSEIINATLGDVSFEMRWIY